jgi:hypothetical protein
VVILGSVVHSLDDHEAEQLMAAFLVPGSAALVTHVAGTGVDPRHGGPRGKPAYEREHGVSLYIRTRDEIAGLVDGFDIQEPGLVPTIDFIPGDDGRAPVREAPRFLMILARRLPA